MAFAAGLLTQLLHLALVLAAAPLAEAPSHGPSALVLILDNSPSSTARLPLFSMARRVAWPSATA